MGQGAGNSEKGGAAGSLLGLGARAQARPRGWGARLGTSPWGARSPGVLSVDIWPGGRCPHLGLCPKNPENVLLSLPSPSLPPSLSSLDFGEQEGNCFNQQASSVGFPKSTQISAVLLLQPPACPRSLGTRPPLPSLMCLKFSPGETPTCNGVFLVGSQHRRRSPGPAALSGGGGAGASSGVSFIPVLRGSSDYTPSSFGPVIVSQVCSLGK